MAAKRPQLVRRPDLVRSGGRHSLTTEGKCRFGEGELQDVLLTNLDNYGCMMRGSAIGVRKSDVVQLWLGDVGPVSGKLRWARKGSMGIAFDEALEDSVLEGVRAIEPGPKVIPITRRSGV